MRYNTEKEMYPDVASWLYDFLKSRYRKSKVITLDSSQRSLSRIITDNGLSEYAPPEWISWDIKVDVVGFSILKKSFKLAFVECKNSHMSLRDLSQLIGYSRIALPEHSFLISPQGPSDSLSTLIKTFNRIDVLRYLYPKATLASGIVVAKWNMNKRSIDLSNALSDDKAKLGNL